jgi:hypothetical protein
MDSFDDLAGDIRDEDIKKQHRGMIGIRKILSEDKKHSINKKTSLVI